MPRNRSNNTPRRKGSGPPLPPRRKGSGPPLPPRRRSLRRTQTPISRRHNTRKKPGTSPALNLNKITRNRRQSSNSNSSNNPYSEINNNRSSSTSSTGSTSLKLQPIYASVSRNKSKKKTTNTSQNKNSNRFKNNHIPPEYKRRKLPDKPIELLRTRAFKNLTKKKKRGSQSKV